MDSFMDIWMLVDACDDDGVLAPSTHRKGDITDHANNGKGAKK